MKQRAEELEVLCFNSAISVGRLSDISSTGVGLFPTVKLRVLGHWITVCLADNSI